MEQVSMLALIEAEKSLDILENHLFNLGYEDLEEFQDKLKGMYQKCENELWRRDREFYER